MTNEDPTLVDILLTKGPSHYKILWLGDTIEQSHQRFMLYMFHNSIHTVCQYNILPQNLEIGHLIHIDYFGGC
jgi:hypothetical protein